VKERLLGLIQFKQRVRVFVQNSGTSLWLIFKHTGLIKLSH